MEMKTRNAQNAETQGSTGSTIDISETIAKETF